VWLWPSPRCHGQGFADSAPATQPTNPANPTSTRRNSHRLHRIDVCGARRLDPSHPPTRRCITRGCPYGSERWCERTVKKLGLETTLRPREGPRKSGKGFLTPFSSRLSRTPNRKFVRRSNDKFNFRRDQHRIFRTVFFGELSADL